MQFKRDAPVFSAQNKRLGAIKYVVIDPRTEAITHLVLTGVPVPDAVFEPDRVLPVEFVQRSSEDRVILTPDAPEWDALPEFKQTFYIPVHAAEDRAVPPNYARPHLWYPFSATKPAAPSRLVYPQTEIYAETKESTPPGTVALKEGAQVISEDEQPLGQVVRVFADSETGKVTHFSVGENGVERMIPAWWVKHIQKLEVKLSVAARLVEKLGRVRD